MGRRRNNYIRRKYEKIICILLTFAVVISFSSCNIIDSFINLDTGKKSDKDNSLSDETSDVSNGNYGLNGRIHLYWGDECYNETYESYILLNMTEVYEAVELLKQNGSVIRESVLFNLDVGETEFDVKHFFHFEKQYAEELEDGKN